MGIHQKIVGLFLAASTLVFSQEKLIYFEPSLLRASATIAPTRFYNHETTVAFINGFMEYVVEPKISVRGEANFMAPNGQLLFTNSPEKFPRNFASIYAGFGYHLGKKNWKIDLHAEPGIALAEMAQDPYVVVPSSFQWSACPSYMLKAGSSFYFSKYCHFFAEINFSNGWVRKTPLASVSLAQYGISAGLGFHLITQKHDE
jgi:hypothetical protein